MTKEDIIDKISLQYNDDEELYYTREQVEYAMDKWAEIISPEFLQWYRQSTYASNIILSGGSYLDAYQEFLFEKVQKSGL